MYRMIICHKKIKDNTNTHAHPQKSDRTNKSSEVAIQKLDTQNQLQFYILITIQKENSIKIFYRMKT